MQPVSSAFHILGVLTTGGLFLIPLYFDSLKIITIRSSQVYKSPLMSPVVTATTIFWYKVLIYSIVDVGLTTF